MHIPDGFFDAPTSLAAAGASAAIVAVCVRRSRVELSEQQAPLAGLMSAFIFAVQMLNFPVASGTSGHLLGGALAAILLGPYTATLCMTVVLGVQSLLFADGGLSALGLNVLLMGVVTSFAGHAIFRAATRARHLSRRRVVAASALAAGISVPLAAIAFTALFVSGGTVDINVGAVIAAMASVHILIGIGEALITAATVSTVLAVRPDLIVAIRDRELEAAPTQPALV